MNLTSTPPTGRPLAVLGILIGLLVPAAFIAQFQLERFFTPYHVPILGTIAVLLIAASMTRRVTVVRVIALVLLGVLAGFEWLLLSMTAIPAYHGPLAEGKPFPSFTAKFADGTSFSEADLKGDTATAIVFVRGQWCPICMVELRRLNERRDDFARRGVKLVAVTFDNEEVSKNTQDKFKELKVVVDPERSLVNAAGVLHKGGNKHTGEDTAAPTTILVDRTGTVRWLHGSESAFSRLSPDDVLAAIDRQMPAATPPAGK